MQTFSPLEYIQIHIANMYGHDKWDYTDRILWTLVHDEELEDLTEEADDPYSYWVAVNEYRKVCNNKPTGLIVRFDATASGAQLLSVMTGCRKGCEATNAISEHRSNPYMRVRDVMQEELGENVDVSYADCKQAVMTSLYGSTETPKKIFGKNIAAFYKAVKEVFPGAFAIMPVLLGSWDKTKSYHTWVMPDGYQVYKPTLVKSMASVMVEPINYAMKVQYYEQKASNYGLANAADITHSVDSYLLRSVIRHCSYNKEWVTTKLQEVEKLLPEHYEVFEVSYPDLLEEPTELSTGELVGMYLDLHNMLLHEPFEVVTVHDSYGCHPNNMNTLRYWYNQCLARLNTNNVLESILSQLGIELTINKENLFDDIVDNSYAIC